MTEEQLLSAALVHSPESVSMYGFDSTVLYMNAVTERMMGVTFAELRGKRLFDLYPDAIGTAFHRAFESVVAGAAPQSYEHYYPRFDRWFAGHVVRVDDRVHVYARDVTDEQRARRRSEALAKISEALTRNELDLRGTAQAVAQIVTDTLQAECVIALLSEDRQWLEPVAHGAREEYASLMPELTRWSARSGHAGEALRTRTAVLAQADQLANTISSIDDPKLRDLVDRYAPSTLLVVPLIVGEHPVGVMIATRGPRSAPLTHHDRTLLEEVAPSIGLYLALASRRAEAGSLRNRLAALADAIPALVSFIDRDQRYQYVNASYERWFGVPRDKYVGHHMREMLGEEAYAKLAPHVEQALAGRQVRFRERITYPSGARDIDAQYMPLVDAHGVVEGFAVLVQDVTAEVRINDLERTQRDAERRAAARLETLLVVTAKLAGAARREDVERTLVDATFEALEASFAGMWTLSADSRELVLVRERGMREELVLTYRRLKTTTPGPITDCVQTGRPVFVSSREEYAALYPLLEPVHRPQGSPPLSFAVLPLVIEGRVIGCLNFSFYDGRRLSNEERTYFEVLALHGAEALRRANIYAELRDVSETRAAMIQASPAAIMLLDSHSIVHAWNAAAERIFGISAIDVIGKPLPELDLQPDALDTLRRALAGEEVHGREARRLRANGESFDAECHAAPITFSDGRTMCLSLIVDISQRKRVERGRELIAGASAIFARSLDWRRTLDEVVQLPLEHFADWCCVDLLGDDGILERVAVSREEAAPGLPIPRRLVHDGRGGVSEAIRTGKIKLAHDITDETLKRIARDEAHLQAMRSLAMRSFVSVPMISGERTFGALTLASCTRNFDELDVSIAMQLANHAATAIENARLFEDARTARREAEDASRAKDEFLAMLGHELRNPLAPLVTALELMRMRAPEQLQRERAVIERQVAHLSRLVDDLLDVSRITRGKVELRRERVSLASVTSKAIEQTSPLFEQSQHRLIVDVPADLSVSGDPTRLAQIIANLLSNAAKYTHNQGSISVFGHRSNGMVELAVRDNGIGIAADFLPQIFDLFVQAPQPSARTRGGLGLGLTIVKSLVEMHGGTVSATSAGKGKGSEFSIRLPTAPEPVAVIEPERAPQLPRAVVARRILVVDDNEDAANLLAEVLVAHGHHIRTALDGPSALRVADEFHPEVAVLDIGLPVMDGYELAERMRATPSLSGVRLIAVTGYGQESDRARALDAGFHAHLAKPVAIDTLVRLVDGAT
ncbi:MAG TPA: PAS domain-containing protein [Kofleriaceae bacterium]